MTIVRTFHNKENPYVQLNRETLRDPNLSLGATGLMAYMFSFKDDWSFNMVHIAKTKQTGIKVLYRFMAELIDLGYAIRFQQSVLSTKNGMTKRHLGQMEYALFEVPATFEERKKFIADQAVSPYFPDEEKTANKVIKQHENSEKGHQEHSGEHGHSERAQAERAQKGVLSNNDNTKPKTNAMQGNDRTLPFTKREESLDGHGPSVFQTPAYQPSPQKPTSTRRFPLKKEQQPVFDWLKGQGLDTDDDTLCYWVRTYSPDKLQTAVKFMHHEAQRGVQFRTRGGFVRNVLEGKISPVTDTCLENKVFVKDFMDANNWRDLEIHEKYVICPRTQKEVPLSLEPMQFINAIGALYDLSQNY
jgi:hypothetical protein